MEHENTPLLRFGEVLDKMEKIFIFIGSIILMLIAALVFGEVVARKFFYTSLFITMEYSGYGLAFVTMLSLASVTRKNAHLNVVFLVGMLPLGIRRRINLIFSMILFFIYNLIITYVCFRLFWQSFILDSVSQDLTRTPLWIPQIILFVGFVLTDLQLLHNLIIAAHSNEAPTSTDILESEGKE